MNEEKEEEGEVTSRFGDFEKNPVRVVLKAKEFYQSLSPSCTKDLDVDALNQGLEGDSLFSTFPKDELMRQERMTLKDIPEILDVPVGESSETIHTLFYKSKPSDESDGEISTIPLVMIHGLGGSALAFHKNYEELSEDRPVYGIDLPGFGLSSRMKFPDEAKQCEEKMVELIESWRKNRSLEEMILLGHSFGGYIAAVYAMKYRKHVCHLVLVDPWGMLSKEECEEVDGDDNPKKKSNFVIRLAMFLSKPCHLKPFSTLRGVGWTLGCVIMRKVLPESQRKAYGERVIKFFVAVNSQDDATGEKVFCVLSGYEYMFPKYPLKSRFLEWQDYPTTTIIYGNCPKFSDDGGKSIEDKMSRVKIKKVDDATHHVHAENTTGFHKIMLDIFHEAETEKAKLKI